MTQQAKTQAPQRPHNEEPPQSNRVAPPPRPHPGMRMTYEQFLDWADEDTLAEWVDGEIAMTSPASVRHQLLKSFILSVLAPFVAIHDLGIILDAPFQMKLPTSGREPDIFYIAKAHAARLRPTYVNGPADLVIELISDESVDRDRRIKFEEYQAGGVREYWLIDPRSGHERADFYQLDDDGRYQLIPADHEGVYHSRAVPGFRLRVSWLWQQPLPDPTGALLEIDRDAYARYLQEKLRQAGL